MAIAYDTEAIRSSKVGFPMCISAYINHGNVLWKVYVMGPAVHVVPRGSTVDVHGPEDAFGFDSQTLSKATIQPPEGCVRPDTVFVEAVASAIRASMGVSLFGFDLIRCVETGQWFVIDVNYYPSVETIPGFEPILLSFLRERASAGVGARGGC